MAQDISTLIPNSTETIGDGADVDGRPVITGADVYAVKDLALALITDLEANGSAKLNQLLCVAVNPLRGIAE